MNGLIVAAVVIGLFYIVYKFFPNLLPESWRIRSGEGMYRYMFKLNEGENTIHVSVGSSDPNSHLTDEEVRKKNMSMMLTGKRVRESSIIHIAITDQNRLIINYHVREKPVSFDKNNLPEVIDTGRAAKRTDDIFMKYLKNYPQYSGDSRIVEFESSLIPDVVYHSNTGRFEMSLAVEFIPILMDWLKKNSTPKSL